MLDGIILALCRIGELVPIPTERGKTFVKVDLHGHILAALGSVGIADGKAGQAGRFLVLIVRVRSVQPDEPGGAADGFKDFGKRPLEGQLHGLLKACPRLRALFVRGIRGGQGIGRVEYIERLAQRVVDLEIQRYVAPLGGVGLGQRRAGKQSGRQHKAQDHAKGFHGFILLTMYCEHDVSVLL